MSDAIEDRYLPNPEWIIKEVFAANLVDDRSLQMTMDVDRAMLELVDRERLALSMRSQGLYFREVAEMLCVSTERARAICWKATRKLRHPTRLRVLEQYVCECK